MSRIIQTETAGKNRDRLVKMVGVALRELLRSEEQSSSIRDVTAFIALALEEIAETIDPTVAAWEKRGYWVKADRFRMEWDWVKQLAGKMRNIVLEEDWAKALVIADEISYHLRNTKIPSINRSGKPWKGAYLRLIDRG